MGWGPGCEGCSFEAWHNLTDFFRKCQAAGIFVGVFDLHELSVCNLKHTICIKNSRGRFGTWFKGRSVFAGSTEYTYQGREVQLDGVHSWQQFCRRLEAEEVLAPDGGIRVRVRDVHPVQM